MRVALVHDWLTGMRGGESVLEAIAELFPTAELYTLISIPGSVSPKLSALKTHTSFLQKIPGIEKRYRHFLPLMPCAIEQMKIAECDLVISSSHCVAKGIRKPPGSVHVSYVHAPMRYMWDRFEDYFGVGRTSGLARGVAQFIQPKMQKWDRAVSSVSRVDALIANSHFIAERIQEAYGRSAEVVHPFVDLERFQCIMPRPQAGHYVMIGAFAPYKRVDLAISAFNQLKMPLKIVGSGQDENRLRAMAGPTIEFLGSLPNAELVGLLKNSKALIFPGKEDFGITPLEAMASGVPVIAWGEGGILDTVTDATGILFKDQTVEALCAAVMELETGKKVFSAEACRKRAEGFSKTRFQKELSQCIQQALQKSAKGSITPG